jgi:UPF0271 protein
LKLFRRRYAKIDMKLDLNCDLGEGEPVARTRALMRYISSANIACGGHAGDLKSMQDCVRLAREFGVRLGAHPGPWSRSDFGRRKIQISAGELELLLLQQVGALDQIAHDQGVMLHHIKLHGALYHATEADESLAFHYVADVRKWWPRAKIYARAGGIVAHIARRVGAPVWEEAFADRRYDNKGYLLDRNKPGAVLTNAAAALQQVRGILQRQQIVAVSGARFRVQLQTLCVHSDTPGAAKLARAISELLGK